MKIGLAAHLILTGLSCKRSCYVWWIMVAQVTRQFRWSQATWQGQARMVAQTENKRPKDALASVESSVAFEWLGPCPLTEAEGLDCAGVFVYVSVCVDGGVCVCVCPWTAAFSVVLEQDWSLLSTHDMKVWSWEHDGIGRCVSRGRERTVLTCVIHCSHNIYIYMSNLYDTYRSLYIHYILLLYSSTVYARVSAQWSSVLSVHFVWKDKSRDCSCCFSCCAAIQDVVENHLQATSPFCVLWSCQEETSNFLSLLGLETAKFLTCEDWLCRHNHSHHQTESDPQGLCSLCSDHCCQLLVIARIDSNQFGYSRICWRLNYSEVNEQTGSVFTPFGLAPRIGWHLQPSADSSRLPYSFCSNQYQLIFQQIYYIYSTRLYIYTHSVCSIMCIYIYINVNQL